MYLMLRKNAHHLSFNMPESPFIMPELFMKYSLIPIIKITHFLRRHISSANKRQERENKII